MDPRSTLGPYLHVEILRCETAFNEFRQPYTNYCIQVSSTLLLDSPAAPELVQNRASTETSSSSCLKWIVYRRYSMFHDLHTQLLKRFAAHMLPSIPPKKFTGHLDPAFIEHRRQVGSTRIR